MWYVPVCIAVALIVLSVVLFISITALFIDKIIFSNRQDKDPDYKYFTPEDFSLNTESIAVSYRGINLAANIYTVKPVEECDRVVIFQHGFGAGTSSYMTEIAHFAAQGFVVVAADAYGCNNSDGKKIIGFYAGAEAVIATYIAVNRDERLKNKKIILVGHSWGAYSVACAAAKVKVDGVVAISGFNAPAQCMCSQIKNISKACRLLAPFMHSWFFIFNLFKFGASGNTKAAKALKESGVKALLIHGEKDRTVPLAISLTQKAEGNAEKLILPDKKHNPYNTVAAENKLAELFAAPAFANAQEEADFYASFDWKAATEEDEEVTKKIDEFIACA